MTSGVIRTISQTSIWPPGICFTEWAGPTICFTTICTDAERDKYRDKLIKQARLLYDFFKPKSGKTYAYSQNHTFIPISGPRGDGVCVDGRNARGERIGQPLSRAIYRPGSGDIFRRRLLLRGHGILDLLDAVARPLYGRPSAAHRRRPLQDDARLRPRAQIRRSLDAARRRVQFRFRRHLRRAGHAFAQRATITNRERINGRFRTNYNILYNLANRYGNGEAQGVADWLKSKGQVNAEEFWTFIWYNPEIRAVPIERAGKNGIISRSRGRLIGARAGMTMPRRLHSRRDRPRDTRRMKAQAVSRLASLERPRSS